MHTIPDFPDLLRFIDERSTAFRAAIAAAPSLDVQVPSCPDWTLYDLAQHVGEGRRRWAATVASGPDATARSAARSEPVAPREREALLAWLAASSQELVDALTESGPDRACFTGWGQVQTAHTCGAVARHQVQELAVHTYDAQLAVGAPEPLPTEVAVDGVEEFQILCNATPSAFPYKPATIDYHTTEGLSWRLTLNGDGAHTTRIPAPGTPGAEAVPAPSLSAWATASEFVLTFYARLPLDTCRTEGDTSVYDQLCEWIPEDEGQGNGTVFAELIEWAPGQE